MPAADGEESGEEEVEGTGFKTDSTQTLLELAYLRTPGVFARDSATRRSAERKALREATEMDDSKIEGWKVMLERNVSGRWEYADCSRIRMRSWRGISLVLREQPCRRGSRRRGRRVVGSLWMRVRVVVVGRVAVVTTVVGVVVAVAVEEGRAVEEVGEAKEAVKEGEADEAEAAAGVVDAPTRAAEVIRTLNVPAVLIAKLRAWEQACSLSHQSTVHLYTTICIYHCTNRLNAGLPSPSPLCLLTSTRHKQYVHRRS